MGIVACPLLLFPMRRRDFLTQTILAPAALSAYTQHPPRGAPQKVILVGGGLAGLSTAHELTQSGHEVTILEARTRAGGGVRWRED